MTRETPRKGNVLERPSKINLVTIFLSSILLFTGALSLGFTYILFPMLVPGYGAGEPFQLARYNNHTTQFPWYSSSKLHLTIKANNTIQIYIDGNHVYSGSYYELTIEPKDHVLIRLKSSSPVAGRFSAWQEPPWLMQISAIGLFLAGLATTVLSFIYWIWSRKKGFT